MCMKYLKYTCYEKYVSTLRWFPRSKQMGGRFWNSEKLSLFGPTPPSPVTASTQCCHPMLSTLLRLGYGRVAYINVLELLCFRISSPTRRCWQVRRRFHSDFSEGAGSASKSKTSGNCASDAFSGSANRSIATTSETAMRNFRTIDITFAVVEIESAALACTKMR